MIIVNEDKIKTKSDSHEERNQKQEYKFFGSLTLKKGCKLFVYNSDTQTMCEVKLIKKATISITKEIVENKQATYNPEHLYFQAINFKNAWRKLGQYKNGNISVAEDFEPKHKEPLPY